MRALEGRTAIVTGGGQGVGRGIAIALARAGAQVTICGRTPETLQSSCAEIENLGGECLAVVCDISRQEDRLKLLEETLRRFGRINILINNASLIPRGTLLEIDNVVVQQAWESGPFAALQLMRLCYPHLRGGGVIINVSSGAAMAANAPVRGVYAAIKAALNALSRAAANEWGPEGIRVNTIMPFAQSPAMEQFLANEPKYASDLVAGIPLRRTGDAETDIGKAVAFLAGPDAAYITGVNLPVDGGISYVR